MRSPFPFLALFIEDCGNQTARSAYAPQVSRKVPTSLNAVIARQAFRPARGLARGRAAEYRLSVAGAPPAGAIACRLGGYRGVPRPPSGSQFSRPGREAAGAGSAGVPAEPCPRCRGRRRGPASGRSAFAPAEYRLRSPAAVWRPGAPAEYRLRLSPAVASCHRADRNRPPSMPAAASHFHSRSGVPDRNRYCGTAGPLASLLPACYRSPQGRPVIALRPGIGPPAQNRASPPGAARPGTRDSPTTRGVRCCPALPTAPYALRARKRAPTPKADAHARRSFLKR